VGEGGHPVDDLIDRVAAELRSSVPMTRDQVDRIMAIVRADAAAATARRPARARSRYWLWGGGLATAAATAAALVFMVLRTVPAPERMIPATPVATVDFALNEATAERVSVVGDFNHWDVHATPLERPAAGGEWHAAVRLAPGRHVYAFVVDGVRWEPDPAAPRAVDDDFGSPNSVLMVVAIRGST
jgi:Glycogen recognition site of AMP-activated protein kinase